MFTKILEKTVLLLVLISLVACSLGQSVVEKYDFLIKDYQTGQKEVANAVNCEVVVYTDITLQMGLANNAMLAEVERTEAYREALAEYGSKTNADVEAANAKLQEQLAAYQDANGNPLPPEKLDLAILANQGAMPFKLADTISVLVNSFTEAPLPAANFEPILAAQREIAEKMNMLNACTKTANDAIAQYNISRGQVPGRVVGDLSEYLGVSDLPAELPYFKLEGPTSPPVVPTFPVP